MSKVCYSKIIDNSFNVGSPRTDPDNVNENDECEAEAIETYLLEVEGKIFIQKKTNFE